ncbi:hypothetical protein KCP74_04705 [Salmonella enterica subsp. enterica]|nr:hypothetical protein KCP74_04705 [Salmonella enterica subsp. enterica]
MSRPCLCSSALTPRRSAVKKVCQTFASDSDRLNKELVHNVALRVEENRRCGCVPCGPSYELHPSVLIENMRRRFRTGGFPVRVIFRERRS